MTKGRQGRRREENRSKERQGDHLKEASGKATGSKMCFQATLFLISYKYVVNS